MYDIYIFWHKHCYLNGITFSQNSFGYVKVS